MSVAFTKEEDSEAAAADLPDRPISPHPNLVTAAGLAQLDEELAKARAAYAAAQAKVDVSADRTAMARALLGKSVGDVASVNGAEVEVVAID